MRCEVIKKVSLVADVGSIVVVDERQYELARQFLKPMATEKVVKNDTEKVEEKETTKKVAKRETKKK